ncbi:coiled-coil domain-containing protein 175 [Xyrichtys novacula]|uniref:Coiled-coil domain-containing protein 175 n=1 Tax=Xyrichtys novacula TaxID=13765 RepID=A0AAV1FU17_XYRNO|nr:coiled-coil domain-containing protein 175 [Xyrichtys novacula]
MASSCLVPDFPAVMVALEHIKKLDKQLKEDGVPFSPEASLHLLEITAAISELEADRRATHEHLEVETIENSKLRQQINITRERMIQDIIADVAAARASNANEIQQLHQDLCSVSQLQESTMKRQEALSCHNEALLPEREQVMAGHEEMVRALNDQITFKYSLQNQIDQTQEKTQELKFSIDAVKQDIRALQQNMELEREASSVKKGCLSKEKNQVVEKIKQQKQTISKCRRELNRVNDKKVKSIAHLDQLTSDLAMLESNMQRLAESRCQCEKQLEGEIQKQQELRDQKDMLKEKLNDLKEDFRAAIQSLKEEIASVEDKIKQERASGMRHQDSWAQMCEKLKRQQEEESDVKAEHLHISQKLEQSKLQLEERIASIIKHNQEIREMARQIQELQEASKMNKHMFERNQEEICGNVDTEKKNISQYEEEKKQLTKLLEEAKKVQKEHMQKLKSDISSTWRRYEELSQEEAALHQRQPKSVDEDLLRSYMDQSKVEHRQRETRCHEEIQQCITVTENITRSNREKQREVEQKEELLKEVEAKANEEHCRYQKLETFISELRRQESHLELLIKSLQDKTSTLLQPKEEMKAELEKLRANHMDLLDKQASELLAVETDIYNNGVMLEQVRMENSRLHLCIRQMTEDVDGARRDKDRYWQEAQQFKQKRTALYESLQAALREDLLLIQDCQDGDGVLLRSFTDLLDHLGHRNQQLRSVSKLLHKQMLDFSKRLGDKATAEQQS